MSAKKHGKMHIRMHIRLSPLHSIGSFFVIVVNFIFADKDQFAGEGASLWEWDGFVGKCLGVKIPAFGLNFQCEFIQWAWVGHD